MAETKFQKQAADIAQANHEAVTPQALLARILALEDGAGIKPKAAAPAKKGGK